jgi:glycerol-3-phosphate dehydrogenase
LNKADHRGVYDLLVIGGGVNGCGIARDAAGRGYTVLLAEMNDLASGTSSGSTKLVHGGLRYLEYYEFRLVREALMEREVLWANAPHIIRPLRFVLPHHSGLRPAWLLRLGLFLYDHMGGRKLLPPTKTLDLRRDAAGGPLKPLFVKAFEYSDCWVDDARLVALNARDAADRGAVVRTRTEVVSMRCSGGVWDVELRDRRRNETDRVRARLVVNAAGPWVDGVLSRVSAREGGRNVRLVKGSHIVVPKLFDHGRCYIFQNADGRIIFAIPYEGDYTLIGTTDEDFKGDPGRVVITPEETAYLCAAASEYFTRPVSPADVVWSYSAVRPLYDDDASKAQEATRDYVLKQVGTPENGALLNVFGGKITTYRRLAEAALVEIEGLLGRRGKSWTRAAPLPGGDFPVGGFEDLVRDLAREYPFLAPAHVRRLARLYGTAARHILAGARSVADLGRRFGSDLHEAEVRYLMEREWAMSAEDVLWRRTKCGLRFAAPEAEALEAYIAANRHETIAAE